MEPSPHILIVDDDREIRDLLAKFLERNGLRVSSARDGREARRVWGQGHNALVVLDLMLPDTTGFDVCRGLRGDRETMLTPIVMLTALGDDANRVRGFRVGANALR